MRRSFAPQCRDWIDAGGAESGQPASDKRNDRKRENCSDKCGLVPHCHIVKNARYTAAGRSGHEHADAQADADQQHPLAEDESKDVSAMRAESETDAELARA